MGGGFRGRWSFGDRDNQRYALYEDKIKLPRARLGVFIDNFQQICYNETAGYPRHKRERGCKQVNCFITFLVTVMANVISDYISKWFDSKR